MDEEHGEAPDEGAPGAGPPREFDRALTAAHAYLGEFEDLAAEAEGAAGLAPGARVQLPLLALGNAVLPGMTFPLKTEAGSETERALSGALASPSPPLRRLVACFFRSPAYSVLGRFGCVAAIERVAPGPAGAAEAGEGGSKGWLLRGLHRAEISNSLGRGARAFRPHFARWTPPGAAGSVVLVEVEVLGEPQLRVPAGAAKGHLHAAPFVWKLVDTGRVAQEVAAAIRTTLPRQVQPPEALVKDPVALSYWVLSNVPSVSSRLILEALAAPDVWARLRMCRAIVESLEFLCCTLCSSSIASLGDLVIMSEEGASQQYVNAHGFSHDVVTVARSRNLKETGCPETQHSWFPGYAWAICNCRLCGAHLGWHFTAAEPGLQPLEFWGLRRSALRPIDLDVVDRVVTHVTSEQGSEGRPMNWEDSAVDSAHEPRFPVSRHWLTSQIQHIVTRYLSVGEGERAESRLQLTDMMERLSDLGSADVRDDAADASASSLFVPYNGSYGP